MKLLYGAEFNQKLLESIKLKIFSWTNQSMYSVTLRSLVDIKQSVIKTYPNSHFDFDRGEFPSFMTWCP